MREECSGTECDHDKANNIEQHVSHIGNETFQQPHDVCDTQKDHDSELHGEDFDGWILLGTDRRRTRQTM